MDGRDAVWAHPDLLPTAEDLDDPDAFVRGGTELNFSDLEADMDSAGPEEPGPGKPGKRPEEGPEGPEGSAGPASPQG